MVYGFQGSDLDKVAAALGTVPTTNGNYSNNEAISLNPKPSNIINPSQAQKSEPSKQELIIAEQKATGQYYQFYDDAVNNVSADCLISSRALDILGKTSVVVGGVASIVALGLLAASSVAWVPTLGVIAFGATLGGMVVSSLKYHYDDINGKKYAEEMMIATPGLVLGGVGLLGRAVSVVSNSIKGIITYSAAALSGTTAPASMLYGLLE